MLIAGIVFLSFPAEIRATGQVGVPLAKGQQVSNGENDSVAGLGPPRERTHRETRPLELVAIDGLERRLVAIDPRGAAGELLVLGTGDSVALREGGECSELVVGEVGDPRVGVQLRCADGEREGWLTLLADGTTHWLAILRTPPPEPSPQIEVSMPSVPGGEQPAVAPPATLVTRRAEP